MTIHRLSIRIFVGLFTSLALWAMSASVALAAPPATPSPSEPLPVKPHQWYGTSLTLEVDDSLDKALSLGAVAGIHTALYTWSYFAWYKGRSLSPTLKVKDEGWFGGETYAGGADKLGHMYSNYVLHRSTHKLMTDAGWDPTFSSALSGGLTMTFFTMIELKDGYHAGFGFSWGDMLFNAMGNVAGAALDLNPELDAALDFRVEYLPTDLFLQQLTQEGAVNTSEDYSGQTFMLAYHLNTLPGINKPTWRFLRYVDLLVGYQTVNFLPAPKDPNAIKDRRLYVGLGLNTQLLFDEAHARTKPEDKGPSNMHFVTEYMTLPYASGLPTASRVEEINPRPAQ